jgi:hypothetical protein
MNWWEAYSIVDGVDNLRDFYWFGLDNFTFLYRTIRHFFREWGQTALNIFFLDFLIFALRLAMFHLNSFRFERSEFLYLMRVIQQVIRIGRMGLLLFLLFLLFWLLLLSWSDRGYLYFEV